jgi:hypothetical protein
MRTSAITCGWQQLQAANTTATFAQCKAQLNTNAGRFQPEQDGKPAQY